MAKRRGIVGFVFGLFSSFLLAVFGLWILAAGEGVTVLGLSARPAVITFGLFFVLMGTLGIATLVYSWYQLLAKKVM